MTKQEFFYKYCFKFSSPAIQAMWFLSQNGDSMEILSKCFEGKTLFEAIQKMDGNFDPTEWYTIKDDDTFEYAMLMSCENYMDINHILRCKLPNDNILIWGLPKKMNNQKSFNGVAFIQICAEYGQGAGNISLEGYYDFANKQEYFIVKRNGGADHYFTMQEALTAYNGLATEKLTLENIIY